MKFEILVTIMCMYGQSKKHKIECARKQNTISKNKNN